MSFLTKVLHNVNNPVLKALRQFQVHIPINARVTAVQSLDLYCGSHVGGHKNADQPILPYIVIENSLTSLAH